jgi:hypothetical protein
MAGTGARFLRARLDDPFRQSLMGRSAWLRLLCVMAGLGLFWLTVAWAVAVP